MAIRMPSLAVLVIAALAVGAGPSPVCAGSDPAREIEIRVDSVVASDTREGMDVRLAPMGHRLHALFSYSTYRLVSHQEAQAVVGKLISFDLPGGRILHVEPREVAGGMIAMDLMLFQGARPLMTTYLKLRNRGVLIVGGPRYEQGMLIISIGAEAVSPAGQPPQPVSTTPASAPAH